jgi:indole-3-glycerol phosphate synthase
VTILDDIAAYKREEIAHAKAEMPLAVLRNKAATADPPRGFRNALLGARDRGEFGLIAEIKKASPSKGVIREAFDVASIARAYRDGGATCLSVLTDGPSFQGRLEYLQIARSASTLPVLRKDFLLDPYQVTEARASGADCILIILAMVDDAVAGALLGAAREHGMDALVEVHDRSELARALALDADTIGINNRDLRTFETNLAITLDLAPQIPVEVLKVAESGLASPVDLERLAAVGVTTFLVGESLMRADDIAAATRALIGAKLRR